MVVAAVWWLAQPRASSPTLPGYIYGGFSLSEEYARYYRKPLADDALLAKFAEADRLCSRGDYRGAVALLEAISAVVPLPVVYNDLGVLYAELKDKSRAINAFREALARDLGYQPVRANLARLKGQIDPNIAEPVSQEVEPNDTVLLANVIPLGQPVEGEIAQGDDSDFFRFTTPPAPRDLMEVDVMNKSKTLVPMATFYDSETRLTDWRATASGPGAPLRYEFSPEPNSVMSTRIRGFANSAGGYILTVSAKHAFDAHEPNDQIMSTTRIGVGETVKANIMDARDTDFYSFIAPASGKVKIEIKNQSTTLVPQLSTFTPDMRASGFGPDVRKQGADLTHEIEVTPNLVYFIQVWPALDSSGAYELTVR